MLAHIRTLSARIITRFLPSPRVLLVRAWAWLATKTDDLAEKERHLETILKLEPDAEWAQIALQGVRQRRLRLN
jgi:hypothetical protein